MIFQLIQDSYLSFELGFRFCFFSNLSLSLLCLLVWLELIRSTSVCEVQGIRAGVQVFIKEFHIYIYIYICIYTFRLSQSRISTLLKKKKIIIGGTTVIFIHGSINVLLYGKRGATSTIILQQIMSGQLLLVQI